MQEDADNRGSEGWPGLIARARAHDRVALEAIGEHALRIGVRTAAGILRNPQEVDDVAQEVALEVLRGLGKLRNPERFEIWTHRIATNRAIRAAEAARKRASRESLDSGDLHLDAYVDSAPSPDAIAESKATFAVLRAAIGLLPPRQRAALVLRHVFDLSQDEIAEVLNCRRGTAGALVSRALATLRAGSISQLRAEEEQA